MPTESSVTEHREAPRRVDHRAHVRDAATAASLAAERVLGGRSVHHFGSSARELGRALQSLVRIECAALQPDGSPVGVGPVRTALERLCLTAIELEHVPCDEDTLAHEVLDAVRKLRVYTDLAPLTSEAEESPRLPRIEPRRRRLAELAAALHATAGIVCDGDHTVDLELDEVVARFTVVLSGHLPREHAWLRRLDALAAGPGERQVVATLRRALDDLARDGSGLDAASAEHARDAGRLAAGLQAYLEGARGLARHVLARVGGLGMDASLV